MAENWKVLKATSIFGGRYCSTCIVVGAYAIFWGLGAGALFTACTTERSLSGPRVPQAKVALAQLDPGMIVIDSRPQIATISFDPPNSRLESASEGGAAAMRSVLNTPNLGHPQLEFAVGVLEFAAVPFAGAYGMVRASQHRLPPDKLSEAEQDLVEAMRSNAGSEFLREKVADVARKKTRRLLICAPCLAAAPASQVPVSAVLELAVEQLRLKVAKPGKGEYILSIEARARLLRASDREVLLDKSYQYKSGPALYIDWARHDGLAGVAQTGYQSLAEQIAGDIFQPVSEPPLLIGPGQKHSSLRTSESLARQSTNGSAKSVTVLCQFTPIRPQRRWELQIRADWRGVPGQHVGERPSADAHVLRFVSLVEDNVTSIEIYAGKSDQLLPVQTPHSGLADNSGVQSNTEWALDGLENDRNSVVQLVSCMAAVPMGIWEQTVGAICQRSWDKTEKLAQALDAIPDQSNFATELADEAARRLRSQVVNPVRRTEEPLEFALAIPGEARAAGSAGPRASTNSSLALQIQLVNAKLIGRHRSSRSRALCVELQATIIRTSDGQELYSRSILYRSSSKRLKNWASSDARLYRQELDACSRQTVQALTHELIGRGFVTRGSSSPF
jgi:hypothetical protein